LPHSLDFRVGTRRAEFATPSRDDVRLDFIDAAMAAPVGRQKCVLIALAASAPRIIVSLATIANRCGLDERTVRRYLETLETVGLVEVFEEDGTGWKRRPPRGERKRARRRLGFVLHLPDDRSTRHPADSHGLSPRLDRIAVERGRSVHC
jgi:hypothetical protein